MRTLIVSPDRRARALYSNGRPARDGKSRNFILRLNSSDTQTNSLPAAVVDGGGAQIYFHLIQHFNSQSCPRLRRLGGGGCGHCVTLVFSNVCYACELAGIYTTN